MCGSRRYNAAAIAYQSHDAPGPHQTSTDSEQAVDVNPKLPLKSTSLNWDTQSSGLNAPMLSPRDVVQVAFLLVYKPGEDNEVEGSKTEDDKRVLGQLAIQWRSALGDRGSLSTGWLTARR
jgi:hypothetical protein